MSPPPLRVRVSSSLDFGTRSLPRSALACLAISVLSTRLPCTLRAMHMPAVVKTVTVRYMALTLVRINWFDDSFFTSKPYGADFEIAVEDQ